MINLHHLFALKPYRLDLLVIFLLLGATVATCILDSLLPILLAASLAFGLAYKYPRNAGGS